MADLSPASPLLDFLSGRTPVQAFDGEALSLLVAEARACGINGRIAYRFEEHAHQPCFPQHLAEQLAATRIYAQGFKNDVLRELSHLREALATLDVPVILLKGGSYVFLGLPTAEGRFFSDIDILVNKSHIAAAEAALMLGGWSTGKLEAYDQRYYREWSHEIPPMTHLHRGTTVDLHHSLSMPTCRIHIDSERIIADAVPASEDGFWWRLRDEDMLLHAVSHLLLNSEFDRGLRDLWDIDLLYRHFTSISAEFPERLHARACSVGMENLLGVALRLASVVFSTPPEGYALPSETTMFSALLARAASTRHPDTRPGGQSFADLALMLREMYLRLPGKLLAIHLLHKITAPFAQARKASI